jgi:serine/threonine protein kinase
MDTSNLSLDFLNPPQAAGELGRLGPYRILSVLGQGGMGVVFLAEDINLKRTVALKVMLPSRAQKASSRERFLREARAMAKIEDDHIVAFFEVGEDRGIPFMAMQLLKGLTLRSFLEKREHVPLALEQILKLGREIAKGLTAAHAAGLIHRDITPANIWLDASAGGRVKILDFGLAWADSPDPRLTRVGGIIGTPSFMAPEQAGGGKIDGRADLFSLGVVLYRLCTGKMPWRKPDAISTIAAIARENPVPVREVNPEVPASLSRLVMKLLAKKPEDRPESAWAVVQSIQAIEREQAESRREKVQPAPAPIQVVERKQVENRSSKVQLVPQTPAPPRTVHPGAVPVKRIRRKDRANRFRVGLLLGTFIVVVALLVAVLLSWRAEPTPASTDREKDSSRPIAGPVREIPDRVPVVPVAEFSNSISLKLVWIPPGKFLMGTSAREFEQVKKERYKGYGFGDWIKVEGPQHEVRITRGFYLGAFEATQGQYQRVMGRNPSPMKESPEHPVEGVTWDEAAAFCKALSNLPAEKKAGRVYRLPTEAEWEYACRAGTTTPFHFGHSLSTRQANINGNAPFGIAPDEPGVRKAARVGSYAPNAWGLYDMHGNVWEWCADGMRTYTSAAVVDPRGPETGPDRVLRGGGWRYAATRASTRKERNRSRYRILGGGFRVACDLTGDPPAGEKKPAGK